MLFRSAVLASVLVLSPAVAVADTGEGAQLVDLLDHSESATQLTLRESHLSAGGADDGYTLLTEPMSADSFYVAGVTWEGEAPESVDLRVLEAGAWSDWYNLEIETGEGGNDGTEPFIAGGAEGVQVRVSGDTVPDGLTLVLTDGSESEAAENTDPSEASIAPAVGTESVPAVNVDDPVDAAALPELEQVAESSDSPLGANEATAQEQTAGGAEALAHEPASISGGVVAPRIVSRSGWGQERIPPAWTPTYVELGGAVIHHTAGTNNYTQAQAPGVVRSVHDYHTYSWGRGWDDIGYNFLVDRFGTIYEGRYGSLTSADNDMVVGGHAAPANTGSMGISVMGTYTGSIQPTNASINAITDLISWKFSVAGVDPKGTWTFYNSRTGGYTTVNSILGHRDVSATICPGNIYPLLPSIRNNVQSTIAEATSGPTLAIYRTNDFSPISSDVQFFGKPGDEFYVGNLLGKGDLPFIRRGNTFTFAETSGTPTRTRTYTIGQPGQEVYTGDIDGDGKDSLILRSGKTFYIYDDLSVNRPTRTLMYGRENDEAYIMDWDGDGNDEIIVRRGYKFYMKWMVTGGNADKVINYGRVGDEVLIGNWNGGKYDTITVRRGKTYYMNYLNVSGQADLEFKYGREDDKVVVGDWDRDGKDGIGVVRELNR